MDGNPIDCMAQAANIQALLDRGVDLTTDCPWPSPRVCLANVWGVFGFVVDAPGQTVHLYVDNIRVQ